MHASELTTMRGNGVEDHADTGILRALWAGARGQAGGAGGAGGGRGVASESLARAVERYVAVAQVGQCRTTTGLAAAAPTPSLCSTDHAPGNANEPCNVDEP
jgi:hypothetical protein